MQIKEFVRGLAVLIVFEHFMAASMNKLVIYKTILILVSV
jgi:hypothetical protein